MFLVWVLSPAVSRLSQLRASRTIVEGMIDAYPMDGVYRDPYRFTTYAST